MRAPAQAPVWREPRWSVGALVARLRAWSALRDVGTLGTGALASQAILFLATPLFLRLYEPADFGLYAFAYSTISLIATINTFRSERLIVVVHTRTAATRLLVALLLIGIGGALVLAVLLFPIYALAENLVTRMPRELDLLWPAPLAMLILVATTSVRLYCIRRGQFGTVATSQVIRAGVFVIGIIGTAAIGSGPGSHGAIVLLAWQVAADACSLVVQARANWTVARLIVKRPRIGASLRVLLRHKSTLGALAVSEVVRSMNQQIPIATVMVAFGAVPAGWYSMAVAFVSAPARIVALAVADVANQRLSRLHAVGGAVSHLVLRTTVGMAVAGLLPFAALSVLAPTLLPLVMGARWSGASHTVALLAISTYLWFVAEPATSIPIIIQSKRYIVLWPVLRLVNWIGFGVAAVCELTAYDTWIVLTVAGSSLIYIAESVLGFLIARAADSSQNLHGCPESGTAVAPQKAEEEGR